MTLDAAAGDGPCVHDLSTLGTTVSIEVFFTSVLPPIKTQTIKLKNMFTLCTMCAHLLHPWLVPSSIWGRRYSWLASSSILPCLLCCPLSTLPVSYIYIHASFHLRFGRPLLLFPGMSTSSILLTMCSYLILLTWPYNFSRCSVIFFDAWTNLGVPLMCSFWIWSLLVTPHIHLSILTSFTSSRASCPLVVAQVSAPYNRTGLTTVL